MLRGAGAVAVLGAVGAGGYTVSRLVAPPVDPRAVVSLSSQTVAYGATQERVLVGANGIDAAMHPGTRLLAALPEGSEVGERSREFWAGTESWRSRLAAAHPRRAQLESLAESALADLWILGDALPAPVAAWTKNWRFIWPRDTAFCAVALARVGHVERALAALEHLQSLQSADGWFEARYVPGTDRAPDDRRRQFDGTGLVLWAAAEVTGALPEPRRDAAIDRLSRLISTSQEALLAATRDGSGMPPVSPDYWEVRERSVTLGIMTATLAGLRGGAALTGSDRTQGAADSFALLLTESFGANGFQRYRRSGGPDSALAFLDATGCHDLVPTDQLVSLRQELARPGGGIAPGASWREDGISWTPSTSLLGLALARAGESTAALEILAWIAEHRTEAGSIPEKVLFDGRPAAVAPLAWTAANVLLALETLSRE